MTWFKVDDKLAFHRKALAAGNAAMGAWVRMGSHAAAQLSDGFLSDSEVKLIGSPKEVAALLRVGFLEVAEHGYLLHDFLDYNPSADAVLAKQDVRRQAGRRGGEKSGESRRSKPESPPAPIGEANREAIASPVASTESNPRPVPARPVPEDPPNPPGGGASPAELHRIGEVYAEAIREATGHPFGLPRSAGRDFAEIARSVAPRAAALERVEWFRTSAEAFARATKDDPIANQGFAPSRFLAWLNAGSPSSWARAPGGKPPPIVTPPAPYHEEWQPPAPSE